MSAQSYDVIIPARPEEDFIGEAIESVLSQTLTATKIFVVINGPGSENGSTLRTAQSFGPPVTPFISEQSGQSHAINLGLSKATSEFLGILDADDYWPPDKQIVQTQMLLDFPELDAVTSIAVNFRGSVADKVILNSSETAMLSAVTFRRQTFEKFGYLDESANPHGMLYRWWASARLNGIKTASTGDIGLFRRIHATNGWLRSPEEAKRELLSELREIQTRRVAGWSL